MNELSTSLSLPPQQVNKQVVEALLNTELVKRDYKRILQSLQNISFTKDNIQEDYPKLKAAEKLVKDIDKLRKSYAEPYSQVCDTLLSISKELTKPLLEIINQKKDEFMSVNAAASNEASEAQAERNRISKIRAAIVDFINVTVRLVAEANDDTELVTIQKKIGSEKSRKSFYQEYIQEFSEKCDTLTPFINRRKEVIKIGKQLLLDQEQALAEDNIEKAVEIKEKLDLLDIEMEENVVRIQEKAYEQAVGSIEVMVPDPIVDTVNAKRSIWKWKVTDIQKLAKKHPELVKLVPDEDAISKLLSEKRATIEKGTENFALPGIEFFKEKYF